MRVICKALLLVLLVTVAMAQSPEPPISDTRLSVNTIVREDIFAGFLSGDMTRFARGEKNIQLLLEKRPNEKSTLLAWSAGATMYRAVLALENNRKDEFQHLYQKTLDLFKQAYEANPQDGGVYAITGGVFAVFGDRLPKENQAAAWSKAYDSYRVLWKQQASIVDKLPVHIRGELLGGLAQSAQRTGHTEEMGQYLDKIIEVMPNTPYEPIAKQWKQRPEAAAKGTITCMSCHNAGRLSDRLSALNAK